MTKTHDKRRESNKVCMFPGCDKSSYGGGRGLCNTHFVGCTYQVKIGKETWESLEEKGICKKKMTQAEKNMNQMHPHRTYEKKSPKVDLDF